MAAQGLDDNALAKEIVEECGLGERIADMPRDDIFIDARGYNWARGELAPLKLPPDGHRVFAIFADEGDEYVTLYGVPAGARPRPGDFKRWKLHRSGRQVSGADGKPHVTIPCVVTSMTFDVFKREIGDRLWSSWSESHEPKETREAAQAMQSALEDILDVALDDPAMAVVAGRASEVLRELELLDAEDDPAKVPTLEPPPPVESKPVEEARP
jgi:hypothetical protein